METIELSVWELHYNEAENSIRLCVNGWDKDAAIFRITKENVISFAAALDNPETEQIVLVGQSIIPQRSFVVEPEGEEDEEGYEFNYNFNDESVDKFYRGTPQEYVLKFAEPRDRRMLSLTFWDHWALDHLLAEAV